MWEMDCEESWALKNWCFWTVVLEKTLEIPLDCKEIQPVHSEGDQPWVFFGRNDAKAETPVLSLPDAKSWLIGKHSDGGRDWGQEEKGATEDICSLWLIFVNVINMCLGGFRLGFILCGTLWDSWTWVTLCLSLHGPLVGVGDVAAHVNCHTGGNQWLRL